MVHLSRGNLFLLVILSKQEATDTKNDCQNAAQEDKVDQHARPKDIVCGDSIGSPSGLVPILHDIVLSTQVTITIKVRYIVVEASLVPRRAGTRSVLGTRASSLVLMGAL